MRVLVVEDDPSIRQLVQLTLEAEGHEVRTAGDGAEGLQVLRRWRPNVAITDMRMPVMDGREFLQRYRQVCGSDASALAMAASEDLLPIAREIGACCVLAKPFELDDLVRAVNHCGKHHEECRAA